MSVFSPNKIMSLWLTLFWVLISTTPCLADIVIKDAWSRATPPQANSASLYFTITNNGGEDDTLTELNTEIADNAIIYETVTRTVDGKPRVHVKVLDELPIPANGTRNLVPGGFHIMLDHLHGPLIEGQSFPVTLLFDEHPPIVINVKIAAVDAKGMENP